MCQAMMIQLQTIWDAFPVPTCQGFTNWLLPLALMRASPWFRSQPPVPRSGSPLCLHEAGCWHQSISTIWTNMLLTEGHCLLHSTYVKWDQNHTFSAPVPADAPEGAVPWAQGGMQAVAARSSGGSCQHLSSCQRGQRWRLLPLPSSDLQFWWFTCYHWCAC